MNVGQGDYECIPYYRPRCRTRRKMSPSTIPMSKVHKNKGRHKKGSWWGHIQRSVVRMRRTIDLYSPRTGWVTDWCWYLAPSKAEKLRLEALSKMIVSSLPPKIKSKTESKSSPRWAHHVGTGLVSSGIRLMLLRHQFAHDVCWASRTDPTPPRFSLA